MKNEKKIFISGYVREILPQSLNRKLYSKNIINEQYLSNTRVVVSDVGFQLELNMNKNFEF